MKRGSFIVTPVRAFADNYIWCLRREASDQVAVVDPGDARPVLDWLAAQGGKLVAILVTHHHGDHTGGIQQLLDAFPGIPVFGPAREKIPGMTRRLQEGDEISIPEIPANFRVLDVPGHTAGHIAYAGEGGLFCGDTLFANGCGRIFDGTHEALAASLMRIAELPLETQIFCAHEYTVDNIGFARWVEPENADLEARDRRDLAAAQAGQPTVPSTLALELKTNPFMRLSVPEVVSAAERTAGHELNSPAAVFKVLRRWKDTEYD